MSQAPQEIFRVTNEDFIKQLLAIQEHGPLTEVFLVEAIRFYSASVADAPTPKDHGNGMISVIAWHQIATEIKEMFEKQYGK